jgi:hypothetical protein
VTQVEGDSRRDAAPPSAAEADGRVARQIAVWLGIALAALLGIVAVSPFWAPAVAPLLPWGEAPAVADASYRELTARVEALEHRPTPAAVDLTPLKSAEAALGQRIERLEAAEKAGGRETSDTEARSALAALKDRLATIDGQIAQQTAASAKSQQELTRLDGVVTGLGDRVAALEQQVREARATDRGDAAMLLALLQMREAVAAARPFPAEYAAFLALARRHPELSSAAAPLADAAREGAASREVLKERLRALEDRLAEAAEPPPDGSWWDEALARLRGLVSIRRLGPPQTGPGAVVASAQKSLARGDLEGAVAAVHSLDGAETRLAEPWLRMAERRLAAETALAQLEEMLVTRLGAAAPPQAEQNANPAPAKTGSP